MATLYVEQDGADFHIYSDPEGTQWLRKETAPFKVPDFDCEGAQRARIWFEEYGYFKASDEVRWLPL